MKKITIIIFLLLAGNTLKAQQACPVNFFSKDLATAQHHILTWLGKIIALNATIVEVDKGYPGKPYYKVAMDTGEIWVASLMTSGYEVPGKAVRILGYFSDTKSDTVALKYNKSGYHVLAFGIVDLVAKQISMVPETKDQVQEWIDGKIPTDRK